MCLFIYIKDLKHWQTANLYLLNLFFIMKKHFLMLASWSMIMLGTASFVSCDDDDDDNQPSTTNVVEKYKDQKGASIDGNDVVYKQTDNQIIVYHFSGDKIESVTTYTDFKSKTAAEAAYDEAKKEKDVDVKLDGTVLVVTLKDNKDFEEMNKQQFCDLLNGKRPDGGNNSDNEDNSDNGGNTNDNDAPLVVTPDGDNDNGDNTNDNDAPLVTPDVFDVNNASAAEIFKHYQNQTTAEIIGDDVVYAMDIEGFKTVMLIRYSGNTVVGGTSYTDYKSEELAKEAYQEIKEDGDDAELDGTILIQKMSSDDLEEYKGLSKEAMVMFFNSGIMNELFGGLEF